jgi:hypothetical protein
MKDAFVSFALFVVVVILTHGTGGPSPFVLPAINKANEGTPAAAAPPNLRIQVPIPRPLHLQPQRRRCCRLESF